WISGGGVLIPNATVSISKITDGTSNTMCVSEQADYIVTADGTRHLWSADVVNGWQLGTDFATTAQADSDSTSTTNYGHRAFNLTAIWYQLNQKSGWNTNGGNGDCSQGVCINMGNNIPLNSTHPGGVNALFVDGSVHFLSNNMSLANLGMLATIDDG